MASNQKVIYVYESFRSTTPNFLGTLFVENVRGRESYSFEYDADWLKSSANYMVYVRVTQKEVNPYDLCNV